MGVVVDVDVRHTAHCQQASGDRSAKGRGRDSIVKVMGWGLRKDQPPHCGVYPQKIGDVHICSFGTKNSAI